MTQDWPVSRYEYAAAVLIGFVLGISIGLLIAEYFRSSIDSSELVSALGLSIIAPLIVAILTAFVATSYRIHRQHEKERRRERTQWKLQTISLLQQIVMECKSLEGTESVDERTFPTPVYQYDDSGPLSQLDKLFVELMEHYTKAPPGIKEEWKVGVAQIKRAYDDPGNHTDIDFDPSYNPTDTSYFKFHLEPQVTDLLKDIGAHTEGVDEENLPQYTAEPA